MARKTKRNKITSKEKTALINKNNLKLKDDFLEYLRSVQRSPQTISGYDSDLLIVFTYMLERADNKDFVKLTKRELSAFQGWLINENENSSSRVRRIKAAMSSLSNFIETVLDDEEEFKNFRPIIKKIENPPMQKVRKKTVWSDEELEALLDKLASAGKHREACVLALAMYSGRRKSELCRFKADDFADSNLVCSGALYKTSDPIQTKGFGLGKYIHCYTLAKKFKPFLDAWMRERERLGIESEWLFPDSGNYSKSLSPHTLTGWADVFTNMTGKDFYWHSLRHYFTTHLSRLGLPDSAIQEILGWDSSEMVRVYKDISAEEQMGRYFDDKLKPGSTNPLFIS